MGDQSGVRRASDLQRDRLSALGELTAGVAHELNNSIGYIASNLHTLERYVMTLARLIDRVESALPEEHRAVWRAELAAAKWDFVRQDLPSLLADTRQGADHLKDVVGEVKTLARASTSAEGVSLDACVAGALTILAHPLKRRAPVERNLAAPRRILGVKPQLMQLAINLVLNALDAVPASGGQVRVTTRDDGAGVLLIVEDNGPGVPELLRERIFEPYVTTKADGTGLGLAIAGAIARHHGGRLALDRSPDLGGARFTALLSGAGSGRSETLS